MSNRLASEKSPYLRQHAENPVDWRPWGKDVFVEAQRENKVIFLSVGYSTCHWCHVMEKESFEDQEVARVLNRDFLSVKVDREERPDVDALYMDAVQRMTGQGGWPMSVWLTPEGKPFFGGTYFPKAHFLSILNRVTEVWKSEPESILSGASRLVSLLESQMKGQGPAQELGEAVFEKYFQIYSHRFDETSGGFGQAPKFPQTMNLRVLMRLRTSTVQEKTRDRLDEVIRKTLNAMARGGMVDHLEGGFHRYSTDETWTVPHFEKMLYDQALLSRTYLEAFQLYQEPEYERVSREILDYVLQKMTHPDGGFYSAEDADSVNPEKNEKEEGYFYVWSEKELRENLSESEFETLKNQYGISQEGNFEGKNILCLQPGYHREHRPDALFVKLKKLRDLKPKPHRDEKILTAWNGWMASSFAFAGRVLNEPRYTLASERALRFLEKNLGDSRLKRRWMEGEAKFEAYAEDYAAVIDALIEQYQTDFNPHWVAQALRYQKELDLGYTDSSGGYFQDRGEDPTLLYRVKEDYDGVTPTSNSLSAWNLMRLFALTGNTQHKEISRKIFSVFSENLKTYPTSLSMLVLAYWTSWNTLHEVVILGKKTHSEIQKTLSFLQKGFFPALVLAYTESESSAFSLLQGKSTLNSEVVFYPCVEGACQGPTSDFLELQKELPKPRSVSF